MTPSPPPDGASRGLRPSADLPAPRVIRIHLERLLHSNELQQASRLQDLLSFLVEAVLAGRTQRLDANTIGIEVFGREASFDSETDPLVRNQMDRLRAALDRFYVSEGLGSPVRLEIPADGYVPVFRAVAAAAGPTPALGSGGRARVPRLRRPGGPAIAVLPFRNDTGDPHQTPIAHGYAAELGLLLTRFERLQVVASHSTFRFAGDQGADLKRVGADLDARFIVIGNMRRAQGRATLSARLYDTEVGGLTWADQFNVSLEVATLVEVLDRIANQVAARVAVASGLNARPLARDCLGQPADRLDAYDAVLRYRHYVCDVPERNRTPTATALESATAVTPRYAMASAMLSGVYVDDYNLGPSADEPVLDRAFHLAGRAVALDPASQQARWNLAYVYLHRHDVDACLAEADRAIDLNPDNATLAGEIGWSMALLGQWERGLALLARSHWLNPHHPSHWHSAWYLDRYRQGDYEGALQYARLFAQPRRFWDPLLHAAAFGQLGRQGEAYREISRLLELVPDFGRRGRDLIRRWVYVGGLDDMLLAGLRKAGLAVD